MFLAKQLKNNFKKSLNYEFGAAKSFEVCILTQGCRLASLDHLNLKESSKIMKSSARGVTLLPRACPFRTLSPLLINYRHYLSVLNVYGFIAALSRRSRCFGISGYGHWYNYAAWSFLKKNNLGLKGVGRLVVPWGSPWTPCIKCLMEQQASVPLEQQAIWQRFLVLRRWTNEWFIV